MDNILTLHNELVSKTYRHGMYHAFKINDPKSRDIHKASVRDRLVHHAIYRILYPYFDCKFIYNSYSCRKNKGTHKAINRFRLFGRIVSKNDTRTTWVLKCDIRKFFANIDHNILKETLRGFIVDKDLLWLLGEIIKNFNAKDKQGVGLPLGNLTSQLLINIYMNEFDQFIKHKIGVKYYIRYADDFVIFSDNKANLEYLLPTIENYLRDKLKLELHPDKVSITTLSSGIDFLGWVNFPDHRILRKSTKKRILRKIAESSKETTYQSYLGLLKHGNTWKVKQELNHVFESLK